MTEEKGSRDEAARPSGRSHDEFREQCALAASGNLSEAEQKELEEHLGTCAECREAVKEFQSVVDHVIPRAAEELGGQPELDPNFRQEDASASFRKRLSEEKERERANPEGEGWLSPLVVRRSRHFRRQFAQYHLWVPMAVTALLCIALGTVTFRIGKSTGFELAHLEERNGPTQAAATEAPSTVHASPPPGEEELAARDVALAELRREIAQKSAELAKLKTQQTEQQTILEASAEDEKRLKQVSAERDRLLLQVSADEETLHAAEARLEKLERERSEFVIHTASLETKNNELSASLAEQQRLTAEQQALLAKDRDIRELVGARNLYITEVHDMVRTGETQKAFGRVFYTRGKSLIFYAYDLNDAPGAKEASTFQAWGRRGPDWSQAFKLGVFYEDSVSKQRWVLKTTDKKTLDEIDAVFITVEPNGGSEKPTGKPLLFAYFKVPPNHP